MYKEQYIKDPEFIVDIVTAGIPTWYYTLPLCTLWFPDNPIGSACRNKDTVGEVLSQQNDLRSFVLVSNNDALEFFRRGQTWSTGRLHLQDVLDEYEEKIGLAREKDEEKRTRDRIEYESNLWVNPQHPRSPDPYNNIEDNDQSVLVE